MVDELINITASIEGDEPAEDVGAPIGDITAEEQMALDVENNYGAEI